MDSQISSPYPKVTVPQTSYYQHVLTKSKEFSPGSPAFIDGITGETLTRGEVEKECFLLASAFRNVHKKGLVGLNKGSVVLFFSPNTTLYPRIQFALGAAGIVPGHTNSSYVADEVAHAYKISGASHILVHPSLLQLASSTLVSKLGFSEADVKRRVIVAARKKDVPADVAARGFLDLDDITKDVKPLDKPEPFDGNDAHETAAIYFSSGTTGLSKAVALTHYNMNAFLVQGTSVWPWHVHGRDIVQAVVPLYHVFGGIILVVQSYYSGCPLVILPRFEPVSFLSSIQKLRITSLALVPPLLHFILKSPLVEEYDLSSVKLIHVGAAPVSTEIVLMTIDFFKKRGVDISIVQGYGMTESNGGMAFLRVEHMVKKAGSIGFLLPNIDGRLVDENGAVVPRGSPGELWVRGPNFMKEYVGNPKATQETRTADGWFKTGDVMTLDNDGFLTVVDRKKELIKYKGFQVAPAELEAILFTHPSVSDAGVIGVYSAKDFSEVPKAYIAPKDTKLLKASQAEKDRAVAEIHQWLQGRIAHYKQLRGGIVFVEAIPKSPAGKVLRKDLRALHQQWEKGQGVKTSARL
ncbi:acetyl-CoA synthetase-like protein [Trametopsis cervina]|nr:acetyl-CoA synthetase-like protein [Trametopsis cervina]